MEIACVKLAISSVALDSGFGDHSHFSRQFKRFLDNLRVITDYIGNNDRYDRLRIVFHLNRARNIVIQAATLICNKG